MNTYSITLEKGCDPGTLRAIVFQHDDSRTSIHDIGEGGDFRELFSFMLEQNPEVTAVRDATGTLHYPDEITVMECAECIFYDIIKEA